MADTQPKLIKVTNQREIPIKPEMVLGRQAECDLQLTEGHASRKHATLQVAGGQCVVMDNGSSNGTFVNGVRIVTQTPHPLRPGDELTVGNTRFRFEA